MTNRDQALHLIEEKGLIRPKDLAAHGISRARLARLVKDGLVVRQARGIYVAARYAPTAGHTLAHVAKRVPEAVFCLLTAQRFHGLTTQSPAEVWTALPEQARRPRLDYPRLRVARFSAAVLEAGIEQHQVAGVTLGDRNNRIKGFFDLHHLASRFDFDRATPAETVRRTFERREEKGVPKEKGVAPTQDIETCHFPL